MKTPGGSAVALSRLPTLADVSAIEEAIKQCGAKLVIIDPLMAYLPGTVNSNRDQDIRRVLAPLAAIAERTQAAIVVVRHLNKAVGGNPLYRGGGSIGIIGAARSGLVVAKDPTDQSGAKRVLAMTKSNLSAPAPSLVYSLVEAKNGAVEVVWEGVSDRTADDLLGTETNHNTSRTEDAIHFLKEVLGSGPVQADRIQAAANAEGISPKVLRTAREKLGIKPKKFGKPGAKHQGWLWQLPEDAQVSEDAQSLDVGAFGENGHLRETEERLVRKPTFRPYQITVSNLRPWGRRAKSRGQ